MNKDEFLSKLRKKLAVLEESEIEDILSEYDGYIDEKIAQGSTEKEAVKSMGSVDELSKELLAAYKVKGNSTKDSIGDITNNAISVFDKIVDTFANKSFSEILHFVFEIIVILFIIAICKIPFTMLGDLGSSVFSHLGKPLYTILGGFWHFVLEFAYLIFAFLFFIRIFKKRYLQEEELVTPVGKKEKTMKEERKGRTEKVVETHQHTAIDSLANVAMFFVKFISFFIMFGIFCYLIGMAVALGIDIYFIINGICYFGILFILLALFGLGIVGFLFLFNFIFNRKNKVGALLIVTLICFGLLGVGTGISALEFTNTEILYDREVLDKKVDTVLVPMQDDLVLAYGVDKIIVDDTLGNQIKVEYQFDKYYFDLEMEPKIQELEHYSFLYPAYKLKSFKNSKKFVSQIMDDLKEKKIRIYDYSDVEIHIYASSEVKDKLVQNANAFYSKKASDYKDLDHVCDALEDLNYPLPDYCHHHGEN